MDGDDKGNQVGETNRTFFEKDSAEMNDACVKDAAIRFLSVMSLISQYCLVFNHVLILLSKPKVAGTLCLLPSQVFVKAYWINYGGFGGILRSR